MVLGKNISAFNWKMLIGIWNLLTRLLFSLLGLFSFSLGKGEEKPILRTTGANPRTLLHRLLELREAQRHAWQAHDQLSANRQVHRLLT